MSALAEIGGRYAAFVAPAYGVSLAAFAWMVADTWRRGRRARRATEDLERRAVGPAAGDAG
jgi:heme exporter protein CcmD